MLKNLLLVNKHTMRAKPTLCCDVRHFLVVTLQRNLVKCIALLFYAHFKVKKKISNAYLRK